MTTPMDNVTVIDPDSPEGKAMIAEMNRRRAERMALLTKHGYTSGEGFYVDKDGLPHSIGEDD